MFDRLLGALGRLLISAGVVLLLFVGYQLWGTGLDEQGHQDDLTREFAKQLPTTESESDTEDPSTLASDITTKLASVDPQTAPALAAPTDGSPAGFIEIPKIGLRKKSFVEGVSKADLRKGPGHYPGSSFPGQAGNAAIAGHRTTYGAPFNRIDELVPGDKITVLTMQGKFTYEVLPSPEARHRGEKNDNWGDGWFAVDPSDVTVLEPSTENLLTLTACHPKYSAKLRIIVQAKLVAEPAAAAETTTTTTTTPVAGATAKPKQDDLIAGDPKEKTPAITFGALFVGLWLVALILATMVRRRTEKRLRPWLVYLVFTAPCLFLLWNCFVHLDRFLPSY